MCVVSLLHIYLSRNLAVSLSSVTRSIAPFELAASHATTGLANHPPAGTLVILLVDQGASRTILPLLVLRVRAALVPARRARGRASAPPARPRTSAWRTR